MATPPATRAKQLPPSARPWMRGVRRTEKDHSAEYAPSSPRNRSTSWKRFSTSTNTWMLGREWRQHRGWTWQRHRYDSRSYILDRFKSVEYQCVFFDAFILNFPTFSTLLGAHLVSKQKDENETGSTGLPHPPSPTGDLPGSGPSSV